MLMENILLRTTSFGGLSDEPLFDFCQENDNLKIERTASKELIIMSLA